MRKLIRANGTVEHLDRALSMNAILKLIGAETADTVSLHHMGRPLHVMVVDDNGWMVEQVDRGNGHFELRPLVARKEINLEATKLYHRNCCPGTTHQIVGDVVIIPDDDAGPQDAHHG